jgi:hypothetical protein
MGTGTAGGMGYGNGTGTGMGTGLGAGTGHHHVGEGTGTAGGMGTTTGHHEGPVEKAKHKVQGMTGKGHHDTETAKQYDSGAAHGKAGETGTKSTGNSTPMRRWT